MKSRAVTHRVFILNPKRLLIVLLVFSSAFFFVQQKTIRQTKAADNLLFVGDFETGSLSGEYMHCCGCGKTGFEGARTCPTVVPEEGSVKPRTGNYMMRSFLNPKTSDCPCRAEVALYGKNDIIKEFKIGSEYWLGFSTYIPDGQPQDLAVLLQFHHWYHGGYPHIALNLYSGKYLFYTFWNSTNATGYEGKESWWLGPPKTGEWTDWVIHVKISYQSDGLLQLYQDGRKVVDYKGPNCYNHIAGSVVHIGMYNAAWKDRRDIGDRVVYHDEVRVGGADASYEDVAPGGGSPPPGCFISNPSWQNTSFEPQEQIFMVEFEATPNGNNIDAITALSSGVGSAFTDYAILVRFNNQGFIDVRNGSSYQADIPLAYVAGTKYHFQLTVNPSSHTYSVSVTPEGQSQQTLATNYAFRSEQNNCIQLDNWGIWADSGSHQVCNFSLSAPIQVFLPFVSKE